MYITYIFTRDLPSTRSQANTPYSLNPALIYIDPYLALFTLTKHEMRLFLDKPPTPIRQKKFQKVQEIAYNEKSWK